MVAEPCCVKMQQGTRKTGSSRFEIDEEKGITTELKVHSVLGMNTQTTLYLVKKAFG